MTVLSDQELRDHVELLYDHAVTVWSEIEAYENRMLGHDRQRAKLTKIAWKLSNLSWDLFSDFMKESGLGPHPKTFDMAEGEIRWK
jgi:hypothetical protein